MREANERGEALDLTEDEIAFYDTLEIYHYLYPHISSNPCS